MVVPIVATVGTYGTGVAELWKGSPPTGSTSRPPASSTVGAATASVRSCARSSPAGWSSGPASSGIGARWDELTADVLAGPRPLVGGLCVSTPFTRSTTTMQSQAVVHRHAQRLVGEPHPVHLPVQELLVIAARCARRSPLWRRQPEHQHLGRRVAEARNRPVQQVFARDPRDLLGARARSCYSTRRGHARHATTSRSIVPDARPAAASVASRRSRGCRLRPVVELPGELNACPSRTSTMRSGMRSSRYRSWPITITVPS